MNAETIASPAVDATHPWLGLASFTEETRAFFHGRDEDVAELARRVQRRPLTILFGQSGHGKTSLLRAGLVPRLRPEGYCPVYLRLDYSPDSPAPAEQIKAAIFRATLDAGKWTKSGSSVTGETLWEFLHHRDDVLEDTKGRPLVPLLIFDQFEEIFTLAQIDGPGRERAHVFLRELADLVENRPPQSLEEKIDHDEADAAKFDFARADYRILISLREDYLAHLESLKSSMPAVTQNRVRLARFTGAQALAAVRDPAPQLVSAEVAAQIVGFISGGADLARAEVEPSLLSLVCRELNNARLARGQSTITADLLAGSRDTILQEFYERALADQPAGVRSFIEDVLLTDSGYRESVAEERVQKALTAAGAAPGALATLVGRRLLRIEERLDLRRVEFTHDVLTSVVAASRSVRREREAKQAVERQLAATREKEALTQRALWRARLVASVCAILAVGAVGSAVFGYFNLRRARAAEREAEKSVLIARDAASRMEATNELAEQARTDAEKIVSYLLDDFYNELEPIGQLEVVRNFAQRAVDYYHTLPIPLRSPETVRNQALAMTRLGSVLTLQGKLDDGGPMLDEAIRLFQHLRDNGDHSEELAIGLGVALRNQARMFHSQSRFADALASSEQGVAAVRAFATVKGASVNVRTEYAAVLNREGFQLLRGAQEEKAIKSLEESREVYAGLGGLDGANIRIAARYADTSAWLTEAYALSGQIEHAVEVGKSALAIVDKVAALDPSNRQALRAQGVLLLDLGLYSLDRMHNDEALEYLQQGQVVAGRLVRLDPTNAVAVSNLGTNAAVLNAALFAKGEVTASLNARQAQLAEIDLGTINQMGIENQLPNGEPVSAAQLGKGALAQEFLASSKKMIERFRKLGGAEMSLHGQSLAEIVTDNESGVAAAEGRWEESARLSTESIRRINALRPKSPGDIRDQTLALRAAEERLSTAAYELRDGARAEAAARAALSTYALRAPQTIQERREWATIQVQLALALIQQRRLDAAREVIDPIIKLEREFAAIGNSPWQHFEFATALYASALARPAAEQESRASLLREARDLLGTVTPDLRAMSQVRELAGWIDAASTGGGG